MNFFHGHHTSRKLVQVVLRNLKCTNIYPTQLDLAIMQGSKFFALIPNSNQEYLLSHLHMLVYINYLESILPYASHMIFSILPDTAYLFLQDALMTLHMPRRNHRYSLLKIVPNIFYFYIRILAFSLQFQCIRFLNKSTENMLPVDTPLHILKLHYQYLIKSDFRLINHFMQSYCKHCIDMFAGSNTFL